MGQFAGKRCRGLPAHIASSAAAATGEELFASGGFYQKGQGRSTRSRGGRGLTRAAAQRHEMKIGRTPRRQEHLAPLVEMQRWERLEAREDIARVAAVRKRTRSHAK